jgi:hypothetical protein
VRAQEARGRLQGAGPGNPGQLQQAAKTNRSPDALCQDWVSLLDTSRAQSGRRQLYPSPGGRVQRSVSDFSSLALVENREATDSLPYGAFQVAQIDQFAAGTAPVCRYFNADFAPNAPEGIFRVQEVTSAEAGVCRAQSETQVTALQTAGVPITCTGNACPA